MYDYRWARKSVQPIPLLAGAAVVLCLSPVGVANAAREWPSYGGDLANSRSQPAPGPIGVGTAHRLRPVWALRKPGSVDGATPSVTGTPALVGGVVYYGDWQGDLTAVGVRGGRRLWRTRVSSAFGPLRAVNSSPAVSGGSVFVSTSDGQVVAVSRRTGRVRWATRIESHFATLIYSSPVVAGRTLVVGTASGENFLPGPYTFRGSVVALDTRTGRIRWRRFVMSIGRDGPGGAVWSSAAIDRRRGLAYIGTGQAYAEPAGPLNNALLALRLRDGRVAWKRQFTRNDVWTPFGPPDGRDHDIGAAPNLFRIGRRAVVGVGDKAGRYATFDRNTGRTMWRRWLCPGSHLGGVMTTAAVARGSIWLTCNRLSPAALDVLNPDLSHRYFDNPALAHPSSRTDILRLDAASGRTVWRRRVPGGTLGALTEAGGVVFVPNSDGRLRALHGASGRTLWTGRPGAPLGGGAAVGQGRLLIGYGLQLGGPDRLLNAPPDARGGLVAYGTTAR